MGKRLSEIPDDLLAFIRAQPLFFVATAPLSADGHVNLSPKGMDSLRVLSPNAVAYLDLNGSGNETSAHLRENRRITFMFCGFGEHPLTLRLYGRGRTVLPGEPEWAALAALFPLAGSARQIIHADVTRVSSSCGFGVPQMELVAERDTLVRWAEQQGSTKMRAYQHEHNIRSIDGLPTPLADHFGME
jgi:predicted pyridoxine 5'-phosphate oxidase superfamily flavin-nucleotide-binding protein